ncbi:Fluconazole resistance protein 1 [Pseudogymnoascus australis]
MPPPHPPSLPSPPSTDNDVTHKKASKRTKSSKPGPRGAKRVTAAAAAAAPSGSRSPEMGDGRHKRVWKACERCRMKKTKCDGESPCKRCRDDGLVCTAGHRKKAEFKQLPRGYAEVLENTQYALIATVHKLYAMVLAGEQWTLDPPVVNARGQPVIHDIAAKLGCIRADPGSASSGGVMEFPADAAEFAALQRRLESEERGGGGGGAGEMGGVFGSGTLTATTTTGPESQFGDDSFCDEFDPGFEMEDDFPDMDSGGAGGYGDVSPFEDRSVVGAGGFGMDGLQGLQGGGFDEFIPVPAAASPALPNAAAAAAVVAGGQMRVPSQLGMATPPQQQQQQQAALRAQQARQMQMLQQQQQQQQQQGLDFRDQDQWAGPAAMEEQMRALMRGGMYTGGGMGGGMD